MSSIGELEKRVFGVAHNPRMKIFVDWDWH